MEQNTERRDTLPALIRVGSAVFVLANIVSICRVGPETHVYTTGNGYPVVVEGEAGEALWAWATDARRTHTVF